MSGFEDDRRNESPFAVGGQLAPRYTNSPVLQAERPGRVLLPLVLFGVTCLTTYQVGSAEFEQGTVYAAALMGILLSHEMGHYLQARRYRVPASLPYFIPMPFGPLGTMGAVIGMRGNMGNRKSLFDIGISGPLAGLVPTLICCVIGLRWSTVVTQATPNETMIGAPFIFQALENWLLGPIPMGAVIRYHPLAYAGWVGVFITALNLIPIGQLDGGHVLYALLRQKAHVVASGLLLAAILVVFLTQQFGWSLMLFLLIFIGPNHPPTGDDNIPLGLGRTVLGWLTLAFVIVGFTLRPFG